MSLPARYAATTTAAADDQPPLAAYEPYFRDAVTFLREFEWIYNFANTDVLVENVFDKFPPGWRYHLEKLSSQELNEMPFGFRKDTWPGDLQRFVARVDALQPRHASLDVDAIPLEVSRNFSRGLNPKKRHEIVRLAKFIHERCQRHGITTIIDVGAGLGYISHLLHENYGYKVLAIESDAGRIESALRRQEKYHSAAKESVRYLQHFVNKTSAMAINNFLNNWLGENGEYTGKTCLMGLHACADLTVTSLDIFFELNYIQLIVIMPCCYHKLEMYEQPPTSQSAANNNGDGLEPGDLPQATDGINSTRINLELSGKYSHESRLNGEMFRNFPLSRMLRKVYVELEGWSFLKRSFLRIACQSSASVWRRMTVEEHRQHSVSHMRRAVLQLFTTRENYVLAKLKRKCMNRLTSSNCDFATYLQQLDEGCYLLPAADAQAVGGIVKDYDAGATTAASRGPATELRFTAPRVQQPLTALWRHHERHCAAVEILTCLQNCVQSICENVILLDRVAFLREQHVHSRVQKVTEDHISPRCHALIAYKDPQ